VNDLWKEELACWRERWGISDEEMERIEKGEKIGRRMPGSFEW
jgi:hypothetical protein